MNKTIENKLLHFFTGGSISEDFAEARAKKTAKLRRVIRVCFYVHCAAAVLAIALGAALHAGAGIIAVVLCELVLVGLAFLSVSEMTLLKTLLYCTDIVFAAVMFVVGAFSETKAPFFTVGAISVVTALVALAAFFAANFKTFLEEFSPLDLRREHYTLLPNFSEELPDDIPDMPDEPETVLPPKKTEMQELAEQLKEILCKPRTEDAPAEDTTEKPIIPEVMLPEQPQTEVQQ